MRIGVFCSGGDAPGMNACVRAIVRAASIGQHEVIGIRRGYQGLLEEDFHVHRDGGHALDLRSVSGWAQVGGTFLYSSRSDEFRTTEGQKKAAANLEPYAVIGNNCRIESEAIVGNSVLWSNVRVGSEARVRGALIGRSAHIGHHAILDGGVVLGDKSVLTDFSRVAPLESGA